MTVAPSRPPAPADDTARPSSERMLEAITRLVRSLRRQTPGVLTLGALSTLGSVVDLGRVRAGDLAQREGVAPATLSRVLGTLQDGGYLERCVDPDDRRSVFLSATDKGVQALASVRTARATQLERALAQLPEDRRLQLVAALPALEELGRLVTPPSGAAPR